MEVQFSHSHFQKQLSCWCCVCVCCSHLFFNLQPSVCVCVRVLVSLLLTSAGIPGTNRQHKAYQIPEPNSIQSLITLRINFLVGRLTFFSQTRRRAAYHYIKKKKNLYKTHTNTLTLSDSYAHDTPHNTTMAMRIKTPLSPPMRQGS
jgi:hypothetical protein